MGWLFVGEELLEIEDLFYLEDNLAQILFPEDFFYCLILDRIMDCSMDLPDRHGL
jgi:hypothetical protein